MMQSPPEGEQMSPGPDGRLPAEVRRAEKQLLLLAGSSTPLGAVMFGVLPLYALRIGASVGVLGLLNAFLWVTDIMQYLAAPAARRGSKTRWMGLWYVVAALSLTSLFVVPLLPATVPSWLPITVVLAVVLLYNLMLSIALAAWSPYVSGVIPLSAMGEFLGRSAAIVSGGTLVASLAASAVLGSDPTLFRFYLLFAIANVAAYGRCAITFRLPPERRRSAGSAPVASGSALLAPLRDASARRYALLVLAATVLISIPAPLFIPYLSEGLALPASLVVATRTATSLAPALLGHAMGCWVDRLGFRLPLAAGLLVSGAGAVLLAVLPVTTTVGGLALLAATALGLSGAGTTLVNTALGRERFARAEPHYRAEFLGLINAAVGVGVAAGSLIGGLLPGLWPVLSTSLSFRWTFAGQALASVLAAVAVLAFVRRRREEA
ncbi:MAG: MFS transporter [Anaerolineae bacterium]